MEESGVYNIPARVHHWNLVKSCKEQTQRGECEFHAKTTFSQRHRWAPSPPPTLPFSPLFYWSGPHHTQWPRDAGVSVVCVCGWERERVYVGGCVYVKFLSECISKECLLCVRCTSINQASNSLEKKSVIRSLFTLYNSWYTVQHQRASLFNTLLTVYKCPRSRHDADGKGKLADFNSNNL